VVVWLRSLEELVTVGNNFWHGRRVFLTGHTGFKGSWLALWLSQLGAKVHGLALAPNTEPSLFHLCSLQDTLVSSTIADVRDLKAVCSAVGQAEPEVVFHLAAQPLVRASYVDPVGTYSTNVMGTVHVLEAVRQMPSVRAIVVVTTDKCYENQEWAWGYRETDPLGGHDPYSNSKACTELVSAAYRQSFFGPSQTLEGGVAIATARAGNVIGGGDWSKDRLIPDILRAIEASEPVQIRNPQATRPWQHVLEPLRGYLVLAQALLERWPLNAGCFNFGPSPDDVWSVGRVVDTVCQKFDEKASWHRDDNPTPHEANSLSLDIARANLLLGWRPILDIEKALTMTVDWAKGFMAGVNAHELTLAQIQYFQTLLEPKND